MNIMLDLETMGFNPDAPIVSIGAITFYPETASLGRSFYATIDLNSSLASGAILDGETILWWLRQSAQARGELIGSHSYDLPSALDEFSCWLRQLDAPRESLYIWGNGAAFDNVILRQSYRRLKIQEPWDYWNDRCFRTLRALYPHVHPKPFGTDHRALDDAIAQANHALQIYASMHQQVPT